MSTRTSTTALLAVLVLAGCGGSSNGASGSPGKAGSPSAAAEVALDAATAHQIAAATQLKTTDLAGFKEDSSAAGDAKAPDASDKALQACISGTSDAHYLADVKSSAFAKGASPVSQLTVSSETQVVATAKQGRQEFDAIQKPATVACLNSALNKAFAAQAQGGAFTGKLTRVASTKPAGADGEARFALDGAFVAQGLTIKVQAGLELLLVGRAEMSLTTVSLGGQQLADTDRDRLRSALVQRAQEAQR
ncbi:MAG: hypothetical protein JWP11_2425 [Frankiales bacterium]|nr:hypothetical protein [Frankiales bacterium]